MQEFRFVDAADQQFGAILNGRRTTLRFKYNVTANRWSMDLAIDDDWVLHGRRLVLGTDLLGAFEFGVGRLYLLTEKEGDKAVPGYDELVSGRVKLYHATDAEVEQWNSTSGR